MAHNYFGLECVAKLQTQDALVTELAAKLGPHRKLKEVVRIASGTPVGRAPVAELNTRSIRTE